MLCFVLLIVPLLSGACRGATPHPKPAGASSQAVQGSTDSEVADRHRSARREPGPPASPGAEYGLYDASRFVVVRVGDGAEEGVETDAPVELPVEAGLWYFRDEWIALPREPSLPPLVWLAAPELLVDARLEGDAELRLPDGGRLAFRPVEPHPENDHYLDESTFRFFAGRPLRVRGERVEGAEGPLFVARTIWPLDFRIPWRELQPEPLVDLGEGGRETWADLVRAQTPVWPDTRLLWQRDGAGRDWAGLPVLAIVLSGAQGDDPGAEAGHIAVATGRLGPDGGWADWMVNDIYPLANLGAKQIDSGPVPMDKYLTDLNSGQALYRPVYVLVAVLRDEAVPRRVQEAFHAFYPRYWCHELLFHPARHNSTQMSLDVLRGAGWNVPKVGGTSWLKGMVAAAGTAVVTFRAKPARRAWSFFTEELTDLVPRVAFEAAAADLLDLVGDSPPRPLSRVERRLRVETEAVLFLRVPQIPSARPFGTYPVGSLRGYRTRVSLGDAKLGDGGGAPERPFPDRLREACRRQGYRPVD